jgi:polyisoprenoid-binding protein YceI
MTIHGQSRPMTFSYRAHRDHQSYDVTGSLRINIKDYGIDVPSYLGVTVKPDVDITVHYVATDT